MHDRKTSRKLKTQLETENVENLGQLFLFSSAVGTSLLFFLAFSFLVPNFLVKKLRAFQIKEVMMKWFRLLQGHHLALPQVCRKLPFTRSLTILGSS